MKTKKEILDKHIEDYLKKNRMARFDDLPQSVFYAAMDEYAEQQVKNLALPQVIRWVASSEREPDNEDTYYVYPSKYSHTAYYNKYGKWAGKWTRDDQNGYEYEVYITHWKIIEPPCV